jgi:hypothetical protein
MTRSTPVFRIQRITVRGKGQKSPVVVEEGTYSFFPKVTYSSVNHA